MAMRCITINMLAPANIISTNITANPTSCIEPCEVVVTVAWQNTGDVQGQLTPEIIVDEESHMTLPSEPLDGDQTVTHSFTIPNLMAGSHTIQASPNTGTASQTINVIARGSASFSSTPPGAQIWIDGENTGITTPNTVPNLTPDSHIYQLKLTSYYDEPSPPGTFIVTSGQTTAVPLVAMVLVVGTLDISSVPIGADIYINGSLQIPKTNAIIGGLTPGTHTYRLALAGYQGATGTFDIIDGLSTVISITLILTCESATITPNKPMAYIGETITLTVSTIPTTQSFNIEIRDQNNNLIGSCTTSAPTGMCSVDWDTTDLDSGEYNLRVTGICTSSPVTTTLLNICSSITVASDRTTANIGDIIPLTVNAQPVTQPFNVEIRDQNNNLIGACTTSSLYGTCIIDWNTAGTIPGTYTLIAYVVNGEAEQCTSTPVTITLRPMVAQAGFGTVGKIVIAGVAIGTIYTAMITPKL